MRVLAILGFISVLSQPAAALTCEQVRGYVETYGMSAVIVYVKSIGATPEQIAQGRACLRGRLRGWHEHDGRRYAAHRYRGHSEDQWRSEE
jgi:hypothetical protein